LTLNAKTISESSVQCYKVVSGGALEPKSFMTIPGEIDAIKATCSQNGIKLYAMVHNEFDAAVVSSIINKANLRAQHIQTLLSMTQNNGFDGVEICYEKLYARDRDAFTLFIQELSSALHANGKLLAVAIHAKTSEPGDWSGPKAQDWAALGKLVDLFQIMAFCFNDTDTLPGPLAPLPWYKQVLQFAATQVPLPKIRMALAAYATEWVSSTGIEESVLGAQKVAGYEDAPLQWDTASNSPFYKFTRLGIQHETWYEDARCVPGKMIAVQNANIGGICIWRLGSEDAGFWDAVGKYVPSRP